MVKILEELAKGNINPQSRFFDKNSEYAKAVEEFCNSEDEFTSKLSEDEKELFNKLITKQSKVDNISMIDNFVYGYKLGVLMMIEVFENRENVLSNTK
ncbi:MAG: DUF6809 family protein [Lachnospirales bacterium]